MIDKKAKRLFLKYMENKSSLNHEEVEYIKEKGLLREDIVITEKEFITNLEKMLTEISLEEVSNAFLYSLSTRDLDYRYILASYIYARSWLKYDRGKEYKIPKKITPTFFNWEKYCLKSPESLSNFEVKLSQKPLCSLVSKIPHIPKASNKPVTSSLFEGNNFSLTNSFLNIVAVFISSKLSANNKIFFKI